MSRIYLINLDNTNMNFRFSEMEKYWNHVFPQKRNLQFSWNYKDKNQDSFLFPRTYETDIYNEFYNFVLFEENYKNIQLEIYSNIL